jgi:hypothetical protein
LLRVVKYKRIAITKVKLHGKAPEGGQAYIISIPGQVAVAVAVAELEYGEV